MSMNSVPPPEEVSREPMRWQVKVALAFAAVALFGVLFVWLEHERAKAGLAAYKAQMVARGEKLDLKDHLPPVPKPEENAAPGVIAAAGKVRNSLLWTRPASMVMTASGRARVAWREAELPTTTQADVWPELFAFVETHRPMLAEAAEALERPGWNAGVDYARLFEGMGFAHLGPLKELGMAQREAMLADLHFDRTAEAYTNLLAQTRLVQRLDDRLLISQLVRYALATVAVSATWEALQKPGWTEAQLAELQLTWERTELLKDLLAACELERCGVSDIFAQYRSDPAKLRQHLGVTSSGSVPPRPPSLWAEFWKQLFSDPGKAADTAQGIWRLGTWLAWNSYADERHFYAASQPWLELARAAVRAPNTFAASTRIEATAKLSQPAPKAYLASHGFPSSSLHYHSRLANMETVRRLVITALALERHRLRHGSYPETLAALVPSFLREVPVDFQDAQPLRYRREADGLFRLWSVGENGTDEGGNNEFPAAAAPTATAPVAVRPRHWMNDRDLLWPLPATPAEVAALHSDYAAERAKKGKP